MPAVPRPPAPTEPSAPTDLSGRSSGLDGLLRPLVRIRRRLLLARLLRSGTRNLIVGLGLAAVGILVRRLLAIGPGAESWLALGVGGSLVVTLVRTLGPGRLDLRDAAREADARLGLRERAASALHLHSTGGSPSNASWRALVVADGARALGLRDLRRDFPVRPSRVALWLPLPLVSLVVAAWLVPPLDLLGVAARREAAARERADVERASDALESGFERLRRQAEARRLPELARLFARTGQLAEESPALEVRLEKPEGTAGGDRAGGSESVALTRAGDEAASTEPGDRRTAMVALGRREDLLASQRDRVLRDLRRAGTGSGAESRPTGRHRAGSPGGSLDRSLESPLAGALSGLAEEAERLARKLRSAEGAEASPESRERLERLREELERLAERVRDRRAMAERLRELASRIPPEVDPEQLERLLERLRNASDELGDLASDQSRLELLEEGLEVVRVAREELRPRDGERGEDRCPTCGKPRRAPRPGERPGST